jgi:hypothetical protein
LVSQNYEHLQQQTRTIIKTKEIKTIQYALISAFIFSIFVKKKENKKKNEDTEKISQLRDRLKLQITEVFILNY